MRQIFKFSGAAGDMIGTCHLPPQVPLAAVTGKATKRGGNGVAASGKPAVLFFNSGHNPRDGLGGLSTRAADSLAAHGYWVFRVDLPGLGDSQGETPTRKFQFWRQVQDGAHAPAALTIVQHLRHQFGLEQLVLAGLCGGAITSIFAAAQGGPLVRGIILLEPEFFLARDPAVTAELHQGRAVLRRNVKNMFSSWTWLRLQTGAHGGRWRGVARVVTPLVTRRHKWPRHTNMPLVQQWQRVLDDGLPILVVSAAGGLREAYFHAVQRAAGAPPHGAHMTHISLAHTNHILTSGWAIPRTIALMHHWMREHMVARP